MLNIFMPIMLIILSYLIGCFSAARIVAKTFKNLKITKVGTGHPDTANIYCNVGKMLGILVGMLDVAKIYIYLLVLYKALLYLGMPYADYHWLLLFGAMVLIGHTLPVTHNFKGGRGIFTYFGFAAFFAFLPTVVTAFLALIMVWKFKQVRFAQYMIVMLPILFVYVSNLFITHKHGFIFPSFAYNSPYPNFAYFGVSAVFMGILNFIVSKRLGEF